MEYHFRCSEHCIRAICEISRACMTVSAFDSHGVPSVRLYTMDNPDLLPLRFEAGTLFYMQLEMGLDSFSH